MSRAQATIGAQRDLMPDLDYLLILAATVLLGLGLVMVASSSMHKIAHAPLYYLNRHLIAIALGLIGAVVAARIPMELWERWSTVLYFVGLLLLLLVLVPGWDVRPTEQYAGFRSAPSASRALNS